MVELKGSLGGIGLPAIVQLIAELHHSGRLELRSGDCRGVLDFDDGRLVAAEYRDARGREHGIPAVASCGRELADGEFTFTEGMAHANGEAISVGTAELSALIAPDLANHSVGFGSSDSLGELDTSCPLLGFADDRERHYSRPTALHRCYASGDPTVVSTAEQRELCLGGRFGTCPRYRVAQVPQSARVVPRAVAVPVPPAPVLEPELNGHGPDKVGSPKPETPRRGRLSLVAIGAGLGLALVAVALLTVLPNIGAPRSAPKPLAATAPPQQLEPTVAPLAAQDALASGAPTSGPAPNVQAPAAQAITTAAAATPTSVPVATREAALASQSANSLVDVRFAAGPADGWVDNEYAGWSDGAYRLQARDAARFVAVGVPINQVLSDVIVSATFRKTGGPPGGGYGIIVRDQGPEPRDGANQKGHMYVAEAGDLGEFGVWRRDGDHWVDLVPWSPSSVVRPGGSPNDLMVRAVGDTITFLVNGTQVGNVQDDTLPSGGVGLFVGGDYNEVALDRFSVQVPD